jgi:hypothetical protein
MTIPHKIVHIPGERNTFADLVSGLRAYPKENETPI